MSSKNHSSRRCVGRPETGVTVRTTCIPQGDQPVSQADPPVSQADTRITQAETTKEEAMQLTKRRFLDFGHCAGDGCRR
ncbi:hypothetical protein ACFV2H_10035 [Streptomyces sp. NPDC059629]|uniref:hypothetical protein n=1 Tax=Streptomyces sp. NPDC059629 TaxID=3346889 RepID=UPI003684BBB3